MVKNKMLNKNLIVNIALLICAFVICFAVFEIILRLFYPMTLEDTIFEPHLRYEKIPNWKGYFRNPQFLHTEYLIPTKYNSLGLNNYEINLSQLNEKYVILVIGDSNTYGQGVKKEDSFPKVIERVLGDENARVINAGTLSYSLDSYLNYIKYRSDIFSPDLVIVGICANDINGQDLYQLRDGELIERILPEPSFLMKSRRFLLRHSHAYSFILRGIDQTAIGEFLRNKGIFERRALILDSYNEADYEKYMSKSEKIIEQIKIEAEKRNQKLLFVILPFREQVDDAYFNSIYASSTPKIGRFKFQQEVSAVLEKYNIYYLDPLDTFRELNENNSFYYNIDGHFNKDGYYLLGSLIALKIKELEYLK